MPDWLHGVLLGPCCRVVAVLHRASRRVASCRRRALQCSCSCVCVQQCVAVRCSASCLHLLFVVESRLLTEDINDQTAEEIIGFVELVESDDGGGDDDDDVDDEGSAGAGAHARDIKVSMMVDGVRAAMQSVGGNQQRESRERMCYSAARTLCNFVSQGFAAGAVHVAPRLTADLRDVPEPLMQAMRQVEKCALEAVVPKRKQSTLLDFVQTRDPSAAYLAQLHGSGGGD